MSKKSVNSGRKVGDEPRQMTTTPSGADPATLEHLNPPAASDDEHADDEGESKPLVKDVVNHDHIVEAQSKGADTGSAIAKEGVHGYDRSYRRETGGGEDTSQDGPDTDAFRDGGEPYDIFARPGAQQPGGGAHSMTEPSNKKNADISGAEKIAAMVSHMPKDTPDDHTVYGYAGYKITIGDLREIAGSGGAPKSEQADDDAD